MSGPLLGRADVKAAAERLRGRVRETPVLHLAPGEAGPAAIALKLEFLQHTGSFKARGAFNRLLRGAFSGSVLAASGGNHGAAVAYAAAALGLAAEIFVPHFASAAKLERIKSNGGAVTVVDGDFGDVLAACAARARATGHPQIHAFDDLDVIAGQGTATLEFARQAAFDTVLIAVGGGGLAAGAVAALDGRARVVAVETEGTACYRAALAQGKPTAWTASGLAADALGANRIGDNTFAILNAAGAASLVVSDADVLAAQDWLWRRARAATEPGGATAFAALLSGAYAPTPGERVGVLVCGANTDLAWAR